MKKTVKFSLILFMTILLCGCGSGSSYTKEQAMIKKGYEIIKDTLLDPESMIVYDCYAWNEMSEDQYEAQRKARLNNPETELPDDMYVSYYHIGARNKLGGMSDSEYIILFDPDTGAIKGGGEKNEIDEAVQAYLDGDESAEFDRDVQGEFFDVSVWQVMGFPESCTDYKEFIQSEEFEKVDVKKILG